MATDLPGRLVSAALLALAACSPAPGAPASVRTDSAGIALVTYAGEDHPLAWQFEPRYTLGGRETGAESFYQVYAGVVDADGLGRLHVLDGGAHRIIVFDSTGAFVRQMGGEGGGPGEFTRSLAFSVATDGTAGLFDLGKRSIVRFGPDGAILDEWTMPGNYFGGSIHFEGTTLTLPLQRSDSAGLTELLQRMAGSDTLELVTLTRERGRAMRLESCGMSFTGMPAFFLPTLRWSGHGERIAVAATAQYAVRVFEGDSLIHEVRRSIEPMAATADAARRELGDGMRIRTEGGERVCDPVETVEKRGFAAVIPAIASVAIDPAGRLWVQRGHVRGDPAAIDLFDVGGDYLGTLPPGTPFPVAFLSARRLATIETDSLDVQRIAVHDLIATGQ